MHKIAVMIIGIGILLIFVELVHVLHYRATEEQLLDEIDQNLLHAERISLESGELLNELDETKHYPYLFRDGYALVEKGWNDQFRIVRSGVGFEHKPGAFVVDIAEEAYLFLVGTGSYSEMSTIHVTLDDISVHFDVQEEEGMFIRHRLVPKNVDATTIQLKVFNDSGTEIEEEGSTRHLEELVRVN